MQFWFISRSFRLLSSHLDQGELLASARMTSPVIGLAIGILATSLLQVSVFVFVYLCLCLCLSTGILATSLFQSSSATTSLVVAMVASGTITVEQVIISSFFLLSNDGHIPIRGSQL